MLIERQRTIINILVKNTDVYTTAKSLSAECNVSLRTIKSDMQSIKAEISVNGGYIESISSKGFKLVIEDPIKFETYMNEINTNSLTYSYYAQSERVSSIMARLINDRKPLNYDDLADEFFISRSTLSNDIKIAKSLFSKYDLDIVSYKKKYFVLKGDEKNMRQCIIKENLLIPSTGPNNTDDTSFEKNVSTIKNILLESFICHKIIISDFVFQNLVIHIYTSICRMKQEHYIDDDNVLVDPSYKHIQLIADEIMHNICRVYRVQFSKYESDLLAIHIQGKREVYDDKYISKEIDDFVASALTTIKNLYGFDFLDDLSLRMSLALHIYPLLSRIQSNLQIKNSIKYEIKQSYILPFDIASSFCYELSKKYNIEISEDEISYIALHFLNATNDKISSKHLKIALFSAEKKSNTFIIRQKFNQWFGKDIEAFDIYFLSQRDVNLCNYDVIFSTDKAFCEEFNVVYLDLFLNESDYQKVEFAINGFKDAKDFLKKFNRNLFFNQDFNSKAEIIQFLCDKASAEYQIDSTLYESIIEHENINTSYFGHNIALLHPKEPITEKTFIATNILNKPINWDDNSVQLVMLVSIEKNNPKALTVWYYLSFFISNQTIIDQILDEPTYDNFYQTLQELYEHIIKK